MGKEEDKKRDDGQYLSILCVAGQLVTFMQITITVTIQGRKQTRNTECL